MVDSAIRVNLSFSPFPPDHFAILAAANTDKMTSNQNLFEKKSPGIVTAIIPATWLWRLLSRRFGICDRKWNKTEPVATVLHDGIMFGEGPRFRANERAMYFVDMYAKQVLKYELATKTCAVVYTDTEDYVSGLGWLPDGHLLIVAMNTKRLLVLNEQTGKADEYADLSAVTQFRVNDMVMDRTGRAYVGSFGFDPADPMNASTTTLVRVDTDHSVHVEATKMFFPNGSVITPDGKTLIVAETFAGQLTAFDIATDGSLSNRRIWADIGIPCDGISLDAEGCVWVAVPQVGLYNSGGALIRVREGGEVMNLYGFGQNGISEGVFACQLGTDADGSHHLYFIEAKSSDEHWVLKHGPEKARQNSWFKSIPVDVGPAVMPNHASYSGGYC